jgi:hypothetical protein
LFDALPAEKKSEEKKKIRQNKAQSLKDQSEAKVVIDNINNLEKERERQWARNTQAKQSIQMMNQVMEH